MKGVSGRTYARGNLFSFSMPWEDVEQRCVQAGRNAQSALTAKPDHCCALPHDEEVLATLVNIHVVGGHVGAKKIFWAM